MGRRWTDEETQRMLDVLGDGGSYDDAARALGRPRNAIAGKFDRLIRAGDDRAIMASRAVGKNRRLRWERARRRRVALAAKKQRMRQAKAQKSKSPKKAQKSKSPKKAQEEKAPEQKPPHPHETPQKESFRMEILGSGGVSFADLKRRSCRYIISGEERPIRYCGEETESEGAPWCKRHADRVYAKRGEQQ